MLDCSTKVSFSTLCALALLGLATGAQSQVAGTYVGQTTAGDNVMIQLDADGDGLIWSFGELAFQAVCPDGSQRPADYFFPVFEPVVAKATRSALRANFFAENMSLQFDPDGQTVHGRVKAALPVLKDRRRAEICELPVQTYTATLQTAQVGPARRPVFTDRQHPVSAAGAPQPQAAAVTTYSGTTSQGYPITIELSRDTQGQPIRQFFFYPGAWDTLCARGGPKTEGGAFYANQAVDGDSIQFSLDDDQNILRGAMRLSEGGTRLDGRFTLTSALFADVERSLHKASTCLTGEVDFQASALTAAAAR